MRKNINKTDDPKNDDLLNNILLSKEEVDFLISELESYIDCENSYYETKVSEKNASIAKAILITLLAFSTSTQINNKKL